MRTYISALFSVCFLLGFFSVAHAQSTAAIGDINGDGKPDVVVANGTLDTISVFLNDGSGNLTATNFLSVSHPVNSVHLADFNGDGHLDILAAQASFPSNSPYDLFLADGTGNFLPSVPVGPGANSSDPVVADFNGDGNPDIAFGGGSVSDTGIVFTSVILMFGDGHGGFSTPQSRPLLATFDGTGGVQNMFVADANHDGKPDLVINIQATPPDVMVDLNDGAGNFTATEENAFAFQVFGDFDGDGNTDFLLENGAVLFGDGAGRVLYQRRLPDAVLFRPVTFVATDLDHGGGVDITNGAALYLPGNGHGGFGDPVAFTATQSTVIAVADLNGDGFPDLVVKDPVSSAVSVVLNTLTTPASIAASTSTTIAASAVTTSAGTPVTLIATVTSDGGVPTGSVAFSDGATALGSAPVNIYGIAALDVPFAAGQHSSIAAGTSGDLDSQTNTVFGNSTSAVLSGLFVNPAPPATAAPTVTLTSSLSPAREKNPVTLSANVKSPAGTPTGNVVFRADGEVIGVAPLQSSTAEVAVTFPTAGLHNIQATYGGNSSFPAATSATLVEDIRAFNAPRTASSVQLSVSFDRTVPTLIMNSTVTGATPPTGQVIYRVDGAYLASVKPGFQFGFNQRGFVLEPGTYVVSAEYEGDAALAPSSATTTLTVAPPPPDFLIAPSSIMATVKAGQPATFSFVITPVNNFNLPTTFSCSGLPAASSCSFSPATVTPNGAPARTTLTITTTAPGAVAAVRGLHRGPGTWSVIASFAFAFVLLGGFKTERKFPRMLRKMTFFAVLLFVISCGGNGGGGTVPPPPPVPPPVTGTPQGTSQITITAASSVATHTQPISLTVQ